MANQLDHVTVVLPGGIVEHMLLIALTGAGIVARFVQRADTPSHVIHGAEGVGWIRGHHADDSEQVLACRAAQALVR